MTIHDFPHPWANPRPAVAPPLPDVRGLDLVAVLPNDAWLAFLRGPLTDADWALIERVERGEISVDQAMNEGTL